MPPLLAGLHHERDAEERFEIDLAKSRNKLLRGVTMVTKFAGKVTQLNRFAKIEARRHVDADGGVNYDVLAKDGDKTVQKELIGRFIGTEMEARNRNNEQIAVTPQNYKFKFKGALEDGGRKLEIFEIHPRAKRVGLFKGEIWMDVESGLSVHESGQFVKSPSVFLKNVRFVRDYEIRDGYAVPKSATIYTDTRFWGSAELDVEYSDMEWDATPTAASHSQN